MFDREYNVTDPIETLTAFLDANQAGYQSLQRRAVIYLSNGKWTLRACTVEAITADTKSVENPITQSYPQAVLFEDRLSTEELVLFLKQVADGLFSLGEYSIEGTYQHRQWTKERVPLSNIYMRRAGYVWSAHFSDDNINTTSALLAPRQPYYPDLFEAVKHWLPFPVYNGSSDSRKGEVILLLPETRTFLADAVPNGDRLDIRVAGTEVNKLSLELYGAWWDENGIHHFHEKVIKGLAQLNIPETANRLDYVLADSAGVLYDFQYEDEYRHAGLGRKRILNGNTSLVDIVREACRNGEGLKAEFKSFIDPEHDKLKELVKTVVAFANSQGGFIFLGIDDDCGVVGIDEQLKKLAKSEVNESVCDQYLGKLRTKIRDVVQGEPALQFFQTIVDGQRVVIIQVAVAKVKPITIRQDTNLYMRRGASNLRVPPEEWKSVLLSQHNVLGIF
jgi:hypothetical protein